MERKSRISEPASPSVIRYGLLLGIALTLVAACTQPTLDGGIPDADAYSTSESTPVTSAVSDQNRLAQPTYRNLADAVLDSYGVGSSDVKSGMIQVSPDLVLEITPIDDALADLISSANAGTVVVDDAARLQTRRVLSESRIEFMIVPHPAGDDALTQYRNVVLEAASLVFGPDFADAVASGTFECNSCGLSPQSVAADRSDLTRYLVPSLTSDQSEDTGSRFIRRLGCNNMCLGVAWAAWAYCTFVMPPGADCDQVRDATFQGCYHFCLYGKRLPEPEE